MEMEGACVRILSTERKSDERERKGIGSPFEVWPPHIPRKDENPFKVTFPHGFRIKEGFKNKVFLKRIPLFLLLRQSGE